MDNKFHYMYEITNLINGKTYIGIHSCKTRFDKNYYGSGTAIKRAIDKYTRDCFHITILEYFNSRPDALIKETIVVNKAYASRKDTYNIAVGGEGGGVFGKKHSEDTKRKLSILNKGQVPWNKGIPRTVETKRKISEANKGHRSWMKGKTHTVESRKKLSEANMGNIPWNKNKKEIIVSCPHCKKTGGKRIMKRWHFDNCPHKTG